MKFSSKRYKRITAVTAITAVSVIALSVTVLATPLNQTVKEAVKKLSLPGAGINQVVNDYVDAATEDEISNLANDILDSASQDETKSTKTLSKKEKKAEKETEKVTKKIVEETTEAPYEEAEEDIYVEPEEDIYFDDLYEEPVYEEEYIEPVYEEEYVEPLYEEEYIEPVYEEEYVEPVYEEEYAEPVYEEPVVEQVEVAEPVEEYAEPVYTEPETEYVEPVEEETTLAEYLEEQDQRIEEQAAQKASSGIGAQVAADAMKYVGWLPYVWAGADLNSGVDCSGFTMALYAQYGYNLSHIPEQQATQGRPVSLAEALPGDIVCYGGHVALYIGNNQVVHAPQPGQTVQVANVNMMPIVSIVRIAD